MANRRTSRKTLRSAVASRPEPLAISMRALKAAVGLLLLPLAGVWTHAFLSSFARAAFDHEFWRSEEFWFFALGAVLWMIVFFGFPRPVLVYVFGHELTHAVWVWLMGGRVSQFKVGSKGGHILTDTHNFWVALSPYFYPIYSIVVLIVYGVASVFMDVTPYHRWFFGLLGASWAFHISFTLWMIPKGQSDLTYHGTFFSLVIIYLMNLLVLSIMLILATQHVTVAAFAREFGQSARSFAGVVGALW